jgi:septal ring factor EnvC (AmiA/AmiB activator)
MLEDVITEEFKVRGAVEEKKTKAIPAIICSDEVLEREARVESLQNQLQDLKMRANHRIQEWQESRKEDEHEGSKREILVETMKSDKDLDSSLKMSDVENDEFAEAKPSLDAQIASLEDAVDVIDSIDDGAIGRQVNDFERETEPSEA